MTPRRPSFAERVYRRLIRWLPPDFRGDFGESMASDFRDRDRELAGPARRRLWSREFAGLFWTGLVQWVDAARRDLYYAARLMARSPFFTAAAILMLAIGTGANAAVFSVIDAVLLRPSYPDADRVAGILEQAPGKPPSFAVPYEHLAALAASPVFTGVAAVNGTLPVLTGAGDPHRLEVECVSASAFPLLGVPPALGRVFGPDDDRPGAPPVLVLSHMAWVRDFKADPAMVGQAITLGGVANTVIGVMPEGFLGAHTRNRTGAWAPIAQAIGRRAPSGCVLTGTVNMIARVRPGLTLDDATTAMNIAGLAGRLPKVTPVQPIALGLQRADALMFDAVRTPFIALACAVGCVLLIACANVANLQLERLIGRRREIAVRLALGASRSRIVRQTIVENLLLSGLGAAAGCVAAFATIDAIVALIPLQIPHVSQIAVNGRTLAVAAASALGVGIGVGLVPALQATRADVVKDLGGSSRGVTKGASWTRRTLVVVEVGLSVVLLVAAGLMLKTFLVLRPTDPGFAVEERYVAQTVFSGGWHVDPKRKDFVDRATARLQAIPGVANVSVTTYLPLSGVTDLTLVGVGDKTGHVWSSWMTPSYLRDMNVALAHGRLFDERDGPGSVPVAIVNDTMAARFWPGGDPVGQVFSVELPDGRKTQRQVIGVAKTTRSWGTDRERRSELYMPYAQEPGSTLMYFILRVPGRAPLTLTSEIRAAFAALDPMQVVDRVEPIQAGLDRSVAAPRFAAWLFGTFAAFGVILAALGLTAVIGWWVTERRREIGIRIALGASARRVSAEILRQGVGLAIAGVVSGLAAALAMTRLLSAWLYDVGSAFDPGTFALVAIGMVAVAAAATYLPARRAASVDPMVALRSE
jgi:putative ABC transport system permease protein